MSVGTQIDSAIEYASQLFSQVSMTHIIAGYIAAVAVRKMAMWVWNTCEHSGQRKHDTKLLLDIRLENPIYEEHRDEIAAAIAQKFKELRPTGYLEFKYARQLADVAFATYVLKRENGINGR